jgi:hypothetical protein
MASVKCNVPMVLRDAGPFYHGLGDKHGLWRFFYKDGRMWCQGEFEMGFESGSWTFYHPNGQPSARGELDGWRRQGTWEFWDEAGCPLNEESFVVFRGHSYSAGHRYVDVPTAPGDPDPQRWSRVTIEYDPGHPETHQPFLDAQRSRHLSAHYALRRALECEPVLLPFTCIPGRESLRAPHWCGCRGRVRSSALRGRHVAASRYSPAPLPHASVPASCGLPRRLGRHLGYYGCSVATIRWWGSRPVGDLAFRRR